jgi:dihydroxy-acid dehydratase
MGDSRAMRLISAESDCLHLAMGWTREDLGKRHVMIQSSYGESHPGSSHLLQLSGAVRDGVLEAGARPTLFACTDMCDGVAQGSLGGNYSLASRDFLCAMLEVQAVASLTDGMVLLSSCDKSLPAHLMAAGRLNLPTIILPGGCMAAGAEFMACDQMWSKRRDVDNGLITREAFECMSAGASPTAGACQQFATAGTMQAMAEALGLALPGTAVIPVTNTALQRAARAAGKQISRLMETGLRARDIMTRKAFENAITVHAAIGGSTNAIMHMLAAAWEAGTDIGLDDFDRIHRGTPYLSNTQATGDYPTEYFWYAGGLPALMWELRDLLHLDAVTVTGKTLGENLETARRGGYIMQRQFLKNVHLKPEKIIHPRSRPIGTDGGIAILRGNLAPIGAVVKHSAILPELRQHIGPAKVFDTEDSGILALLSGTIQPGDIIVIAGFGPKAAGMPELFRISEVIAADDVLARSVAIITDGRYSGCTRGPAIGYVCPEALEGGPIGRVLAGDVIRIDIPGRKLDVVEGMHDGKILSGDALLQSRHTDPARFARPDLPRDGALALFRANARPGLLGGNMVALPAGPRTVPPMG